MPIDFEFKAVVSWLKTQLDTFDGFAILDGENAIMHVGNKVSYLTNFFSDAKEMKLKPIIVAKVSNLNRLKTRIPEVEIPDDIMYFFLHGDNKKCPDDAFIIELYNNLKSEGINSKIFTVDKFSNRKNWDGKVFPTMISYNLFPTRPRTILDPRTIVYKPNLENIIATELSDKIMLH